MVSIEDAILSKLGEELSSQIDYKGIAKSLAPVFKKRIIDRVKDQLENDFDIEWWLKETLKDSILDEAMVEVSKAIAEAMISTVRK